MSEVVANNELSSDTIAETGNDCLLFILRPNNMYNIVNQIAHIKNLNKDLLKHSRKKRFRDDDEFDELEEDEEQKRYKSKDSFLSINSLIHDKEK